MEKKKKDPQFMSGSQVKDSLKGYYGLDAEQSLQSAHFATTENPYLKEQYEEEDSDKA